jgi:superfamily II DNA or RNA helicase
VAVPLRVTNSYCYLPAEMPGYVHRELDRLLAYKVDGAQFAEAFRNHVWDGKEHLLRKVRGANEFCFPTGVLEDVLRSDLAPDLNVIDARTRPAERREFTFRPMSPDGQPIDPRPYQWEAAAAALADRGAATGRSMLHLPIRSGKTMIASILCWKTGVRALMVVPSTLLMAQTAEVFRRNIPDAPVGVIGDGVWDPQYITVATIQTLLARPQEAKELLANVGLLIQDEGHHLEGETWRKPIIESDAYWKVGLSATIFANPDIPAERSAIWMKASVGPIRHKVSMKFMFDEGYLVPPVIAVYPIHEPDGHQRVGYSTAYKQLIAESEPRNAAIAELGEQAALAGYRVLVDTGRRKQLARIEEMLSARNIRTVGMHGNTPLAKRQRGLADFKAKKVHAVVGTVLGEGVDIPELEVVINAEALCSKTAVLQRMRNLTQAEGKDSAFMVDFFDHTHPKLAAHSKARIELYRGIRGFTVIDGDVRGGRFIFDADRFRSARNGGA